MCVDVWGYGWVGGVGGYVCSVRARAHVCVGGGGWGGGRGSHAIDLKKSGTNKILDPFFYIYFFLMF